MQNLRVGVSNCLRFYDSGANAHIIDGQLISSKYIALGVIQLGPSSRFNLGPGEDGKYDEITSVGMENVIGGFGEYT